MPNIDKAPTNQDAFSERLFYSSACRAGFAHLIQHLDFRGARMLLPAYIGWSVNEGSGVFDPIQEYKLNYEFYRVKRDLSIDVDDLKTRLGTGNVKAVLLIHYFGFLQSDISTIAALCRKSNVLLIEDCAHTLTSALEGRPLGHWGDFGLYSLHKILPLPNGGILRINNPDYFGLPGLDDNHRIQQATLERFCSARLDEISSIRRRNYMLLADYLKVENEIEILYPQLGAGIVPHTFPILLRNLSRESIYFAMIGRGVRVIALYYRLIDQISEKDHPVSYDLSRRILNLPIHQDLTEDDMRFVASTLHEILQKA